MASNQFANDGSFMELFRKRMEEQQKAKEATDTAQTITDPLDSQQKGQESRTKSRTTETKTEGDTRESEKREEESPAGPKSTPYQGVIGKRKALAKSIEIREKRKRRREELEEQLQAEQEASKNSAWKAYMAEVKAYEARSCSDQDGHKRPLVK